MRFLIKEALYVIAALCSIYATVYILVKEDWKCQMWAFLGAFLVAYIGYKVCKFMLEKKNRELKAMAKRKKELEYALLGKDRLSSGYNPDEHF